MWGRVEDGQGPLSPASPEGPQSPPPWHSRRPQGSGAARWAHGPGGVCAAGAPGSFVWATVWVTSSCVHYGSERLLP